MTIWMLLPKAEYIGELAIGSLADVHYSRSARYCARAARITKRRRPKRADFAGDVTNAKKRGALPTTLRKKLAYEGLSIVARGRSYRNEVDHGANGFTWIPPRGRRDSRSGMPLGPVAGSESADRLSPRQGRSAGAAKLEVAGLI
jgi:hypothetical protein